MLMHALAPWQIVRSFPEERHGPPGAETLVIWHFMVF
jgi:hypothetical protein